MSTKFFLCGSEVFGLEIVSACNLLSKKSERKKCLSREFINFSLLNLCWLGKG